MTKENADKSMMSLGAEFEVIEDSPAAEAAPSTEAQPAPAAAAAAAPGAGPARGMGVQAAPGSAPHDPPFGPIRSANAWASMGLVIAATGLLGPWAPAGANIVHGGLLAYTLWFLIRGGFLAVQRTGQQLPIVLPALLLVYGVMRLALPGGMSALGWGATEGMLDTSGALLTAIGGLVAILMPKTASKKDAKLPPPGNPLQLDKQFSLSLLAYLMIFVGLMMPWTDQARGVDSMMGVVSLLLAMLMIWASWVSMWQLWQKPLVMGKMGLLLFLAPLECFLMGAIGLVRLMNIEGEEGVYTFGTAYPSDGPVDFMAYSGGPLLVLLASCYALYLIGAGAKEAMALSKQKKADEIAARKAARASKKKK